MGALLPPPQYDHPPSIPVIEKVLTHAEIQKICTRGLPMLPAGKYYGGCTVVTKTGTRWDGPQFIAFMGDVQVFWAPPNGRKCFVNIVDTMPEGVKRSDVVRHELAHCNGWNHSDD